MQQIGIGIKLLDYVQFTDGFVMNECKYVDFDYIYDWLENRKYKYTIMNPPGGLGTPMRKYLLTNDSYVLVKDARLATNYNLNVCEECKFFPCQDAMISLRITANGCLKRCLIRDDNMISFYDDLIKKDYSSVKKKIENIYTILVESKFYEKMWRDKVEKE